MTWEAHQGHGFFGFSPDRQQRWAPTKKDPRPVRVDIEEALTESAPFREQFWKWMRWPEAPPFSGGVWDAWPAREADALAFAKREWMVVQAYLKSLEA